MEAKEVPTEPILQTAHDPVVVEIPNSPEPSKPPANSPPIHSLEPAARPLWVDWNRWLQEHGQPPAKVVPGSRRALWDRTAVYLGFEPRLLEGRVEVFHRDVEKTFVPLLTSATAIPQALRSIVVDPGHGGTNWGTRAITGNAYEKDLTLDWARRLKPLLEARGWHVQLTRTNDASMELPERVEAAERAGAALFVSLHFNAAFPKEEVHGLETYCVTPQGLPSNVTRDFADDATKAWPNNTFDAENLRLGLEVHRRLLAVTGAADRGVKRARFMGVLRNQTRPAILIEGGYLSNPEESRRILTPAYRQKLAEAVAAALD
jgi:N-acetylmuramoyl-L-alanine amidase